MSPSAAPADAVAESEAIEAARQAMEAASLLERLQAMRRYEASQLDALTLRALQIEDDQAVLVAQTAVTESLVASEQERLDALLRAAYRSTRSSPLEQLFGHGTLVDGIVHALAFEALGDEERRLVDHLRSLKGTLADRRQKLDRDAAELAGVRETIAAKRDALQRLEARVRRLVDAQRQGGDRARAAAELEIVQELAAEQERANDELVKVVAKLAPFFAPVDGTWRWPTEGALSQGFGPSLLSLEPALEFHGVLYAHFHPAIDVAAPLYAPVLAAADGRVSFVGHFTDGAMVVLVSHGDGFVSLYAHLDDGAHAPVVRVGDIVHGGDRLGSIGLTGISTGPHLHFAVLKDGAPVDPRALLPAR